MHENSFTKAKKKKKKIKKKYSRKQTIPIKFADYAYDVVFFGNTPAQAKSLHNSLKQAARGIGLYMNADKPELMYFSSRWRNLHIK